MAGTKSTKKDLESKIAELEEKLAKLSSQLESQPQAAPKPAPKPQTTAPPPPAPKPQTTAPPPKPAPKPQETELAVWEQWKNAPMSDFHAYRAKVTGYSPAPNRYYASKHVLSADVPTSDWNLQKAKVTGYTQPSNKYFATRERLAYHPRQKTFTGYGMRAIAATVQSSPPPTPPPPAPKPAQGTLPKDTVAQTSGGSSRKEQLEAYEKAYLARLQQQEHAKAAPPATKPNPTRGSLPAGFKPQTAPTPQPAPKTNPTRGSMPQGWKPS
jgi:hypothetical protein